MPTVTSVETFVLSVFISHFRLVYNAREASVISDQSILVILSTHNEPIMISAGDVVMERKLNLLANGKKRIDIATKSVVDKAVSPVRPH